jgi:hypothetical protein
MKRTEAEKARIGGEKAFDVHQPALGRQRKENDQRFRVLQPI